MMKSEVQIEKLLAGVRRRDIMSFQYLFRMYFSKMTLFAEYFLMDRGDAEDVVQDIFSDLWTDAATLPEISNFKSYLFVLVKNRCFNRLKHLEVEDAYRQRVNEAQKYADMDETDLDEELVQKVYDTIEELPGQAKAVFKSCILEGKKCKEVADEMGLSVHTVNTHMKRSYKFLRTRLGVSYLLILATVI